MPRRLMATGASRKSAACRRCRAGAPGGTGPERPRGVRGSPGESGERMRAAGLEPARVSPREPKSRASASSATPASSGGHPFDSIVADAARREPPFPGVPFPGSVAGSRCRGPLPGQWMWRREGHEGAARRRRALAARRSLCFGCPLPAAAPWPVPFPTGAAARPSAEHVDSGNDPASPLHLKSEVPAMRACGHTQHGCERCSLRQGAFIGRTSPHNPFFRTATALSADTTLAVTSTGAASGLAR